MMLNKITCKVRKQVFSIIVAAMALLIGMCPVYANVWDELGKYHDQSTEREAVAALSPFLKFMFFFFAIAAVVVIVITVLAVVFKAGKVKAGKDSFTKKWVVETGIIIIICIAVGGGSWIKLLSAGQKTVVDPATNILTNQPAIQGTQQQSTQQN